MLIEETNLDASQLTWAKISNGRIVVKADETDTKAVSRVNKVGKTVFERSYKSIAGKISALSLEENTFGEQQVNVTLELGDKRGVLSIYLDSAYGRGFINQIFNVDLTRPVIFTPWMKVIDDKKRTNLYLNYEGRDKVEYKLPEGTPELKFVETKKGKVLDPVSKAEFDEFIENKLREFIKTNNLEFQGVVRNNNEYAEGVDTTPLSSEELREFNKTLAKAKKLKKDNEPLGDDWFDEL